MKNKSPSPHPYIRLGILMSLLLLASIGQAQESRTLDLFPSGEINLEKVGLNAFGNQNEVFGTPEQQFDEIRSTLGIKHLRLLFAWTEAVQPTPESKPDHSFNLELIRSLPKGSKALVVISNLPDWMNDSSNWINGDPRLTFMRRWVKPVIRRFRRKRKVKAFQIFNEPNNLSFFESTVLGTLDSPENYMSLLKKAHKIMRRKAPKKILVGAATTSIFQNFPYTLEYNQQLLSLGIEQYIDKWGIHVYGKSVERYYLGVGDFLTSLSKPIWVTETGQQGHSEQLDYVERMWPFLEENVPGIERFYYYRFAEATNADDSLGLKSNNQSKSDLYDYLAANSS